MSYKNKHIRASFFLDLFFKKKDFPRCYTKITNTFTNSLIYKNNTSIILNSNYSIFNVYDIPNYLTPEFCSPDSFKLLTAPLYPGYLIDLTCFKDLEDYLTNHLGSPRKSQLKRYRKRLDLCIAPNYKIYFGAINKEEYNTIFEALLSITERRFKQKEEVNFEIPFLKIYHDIMYPLILEKKASIFVIYHKSKPINITLNFIDNETIFHWNSCYDIDYQMFNLGHINMVNHLDWAFNNGFKLFDMSRGDFLHKRKYINKKYMYIEHLIYNSKSAITTFKAYFEILKLKTRFTLINLLKSVNFHKVYRKYAKLKYRLTYNTDLKNITSIYNVSQIPTTEELQLIDVNKNAFLIQPLNYFIHKNQEFVDNVKVYSCLKENNTYYFKGLKSQQKLTITK
ncbi:GNAT family N-acetyltransferase [Sabulilitoribacter multivorans]|uniref:GNAT family N-acetyltransferase n=1 Tax=Flaviramulus multivorans TaxID=1304750 RepID=A0ABS9IJL5_9FLAO|nr:GNAT family N-acetyltransferase [Flaviramulus multivorans]MCF7560796.1 GNAT family N-acetyltransferase [Flaviramulus multivorans]